MMLATEVGDILAMFGENILRSFRCIQMKEETEIELDSLRKLE
jgi:hypothetical protein